MAEQFPAKSNADGNYSQMSIAVCMLQCQTTALKKDTLLSQEWIFKVAPPLQSYLRVSTNEAA